MYVDKNNSLVGENDLLLFDNGSIYKLVKVEETYYLKSMTARLPMLKADMIILNSCFSSAKLINTAYWVLFTKSCWIIADFVV